MEDIVTRSGKNLDIIFLSIAATILSPPLAVLGALLAGLYYSRADGRKKPNLENYSYSKLKEIVYNAILEHNHRITKKLIDYGIKKSEADRLVNRSAYEDYIDSLIITYA